MDVSQFTAPRSDQLNADDLLAGPRTVTITHVEVPGGEQPVHVHLQGWEGRPWKPSKTMLRILMLAWGSEADAWAGKRLRLYRDPEVRFGGKAVGGIRISHMEGLDQARTWSLTRTRGSRAPYTVMPLTDTPPVTPEMVQAATTHDELRTMWATATPEVQDLIRARATTLQQTTGDGGAE